jgi:hypothetical protein
LTPKLILGEIWYRSHGLHLIGAPTQCTYPRFNQLGGTWLELFSTRPEPISTQLVIPDKAEHSTTSPEEESSNNQDQSSLAKHSGAADEVWYHGYQVS